ncbi:MAG: ammonium transporter [Eubacteriales bacterium]
MNADIAWLLTASALVFFMTPGLAFFYGGLVKRKNVINTMMSSVFIMGMASVMWVLIGYSLSFSGDVGGIIGNFKWLGLNNFGAEPGPWNPTVPNLVFAIFQMMFAIITPAVICGAVVERMRFSAMAVFVTVWSLLVYYPLAHMVWGGGLISQLGAVDFAGGYVVEINSGVSALVAAIVVGTRKHHGKITYHPHNIPFVFLGASILWFGWFGFNAGSAGGANFLSAHSFMTTNTSAAAALLVWMLIEKIHNDKPTLVGASTGLVIGLVAITPGAGFVPIWAAIIIGACASIICYLFITRIKPRFRHDDSLDVFICHGISGIWGCIATGIFALTSINGVAKWNGLVYGETALFIRQLAAVGITVVVAVLGTLVALGAARLVTGRLRVPFSSEDIGLDIAEHGEDAYPSYLGLD